MDWRLRFDAEMEKAEQARQRGNEGQARVCARRAAAIAVAEFFARRGTNAKGSAVDLLQQLAAAPSIPPELQPLVEHLLQQVDVEFKLPRGIDLLAEARRLREALLGD